TVVQAPHLVHMASEGSSSVFISPGTFIPVLVTTLRASVGHILAQAPIFLHLSSSKTSPSSDAGLAGPNSTSRSMASTGHIFSHKPQYVQISGSSTVRVDGFSIMKSPGHDSTHMLQPMHVSSSTVKFLTSLVRFSGFLPDMKTAFQGQVCEQIPHLIQVSSSISMVAPGSERVMASTGHSSTHIPHPTQSAMYMGPVISNSFLAGSLTPSTPITSTGHMSTHL